MIATHFEDSVQKSSFYLLHNDDTGQKLEFLLSELMTTIKLSLEKEARRTSIDLNAETLTFEKLNQMILKFFPMLDGKAYRVCYQDDEDLITLSRNEELAEAIKLMLSKSSTLRFSLLPPMTVIEQSNRDCLVKTTNTIGDPCPSTFGKSIRHYVHRLQSRNQIGDLQFHRNPEEPFSFPTSLAIPLIGEYYDEVTSVVPDHFDLIYAEDLCLSMMESYQREQDRMTVASEIFQSYFGRAISRLQFDSTSGSSITTDGTITLLLTTLNEKAMIFNYEAKNELGQGGSSAVEKCLWYHVQWLCDQQPKLLERCCCPAILASLVGPFLSFSVGIQHAGRYITDPVTPFLHLLVLPYQQEAMMKVAQALRATKNAITRLIIEYQRWDHLSALGDQIQ